MTWNHRVIEYMDPNTDKPWLSIHEVYYDQEGRPMCYTNEPIGVVGDDREELLRTLERMKMAVEKPFLRESDFFKSVSREGGND